MRLDFDQYMLALANIAALRGTCAKRNVGAVIADANKRIVAVSYNGPPSGQLHCLDNPCKALDMEAPVSHLACRAIHAETNVLLLAGRLAEGGTMAITTSPCMECAKLIANAKIQTLVLGETNRLFREPVPAYNQTPYDLLVSAGILIKEMK